MTIQEQALPWSALGEEATRHLQALLRCDTTKTETSAIAYLHSQLELESIETRIIEPTPGRPNIWARLPGNGTQRPLLLLSHVDVVPVERENWTVDPFGGEIQNGYLYGRGAVDMKCMTAKELTFILHAARQARASGQSLNRDIVFLAVADEENASTHGMAWIAEHEPGLLDAEYALNEGGGYAIELGGKRIYLCETAQKGSVEVTLRAVGEPGHGSVPHKNNSAVRLARAVQRIAARPLPLHATATSRRFISLLAQTQTQPSQAILLQALHPLLSEQVMRVLPETSANGLRAMLHNTASPTFLQAGQALNVIPGEAIARLDGRIIPGQTSASFAEELRQRIHDPQVEVRVDPQSLGHEGSAETPLFAALRDAIARHDPDALVAPYLFPATSDSRFLAPLGVIAYGFDPMQPEPGWPSPQQIAHGHDERISLANLEFGVKVLFDAIYQLCR